MGLAPAGTLGFRPRIFMVCSNRSAWFRDVERMRELEPGGGGGGNAAWALDGDCVCMQDWGECRVTSTVTPPGDIVVAALWGAVAGENMVDGDMVSAGEAAPGSAAAV